MPKYLSPNYTRVKTHIMANGKHVQDDGRNILQVAQKFINIGMFFSEKVWSTLPKSIQLKIGYKHPN